MIKATPEQCALLCTHITRALEEQDDPEVALAAARRLDAGEFRILSEWGYDESGEIDVYSCRYRVEIHVIGDEWVPLTRVHWTALGVSMDQVLGEAAAVRQQHEEGTYPGGPNDPAT